MSTVSDGVPRWSDGRQDLLNAQPVPRRWRDAPFPPGPIPVSARLVWAEDGEEWLDTVAEAWTDQVVLVQVPDRRCTSPEGPENSALVVDGQPNSVAATQVPVTAMPALR